MKQWLKKAKIYDVTEMNVWVVRSHVFDLYGCCLANVKQQREIVLPF